MTEIDRPRCVRIISDVIAVLDETMQEHHDVVDYDDMVAMLKGHAELDLDKRAMMGLKDYLERDCE